MKKSNQLARKLRENGVKPESIVGLMISRSPWMIIGVLGIIKAGGAFLPCDTDYPNERIRFMLEDSKSEILLTQKNFKERLDFDINTLFIDNNDIYNLEKTNLICVNNPLNLVYIIYTSGSTGNPKGVMIEHKALNNFIQGLSLFMDYSPGVAALSMSTMSFDVFICEIMPSIINGLKVVLANEEQQKDLKLLCRLIAKHKVEKMVATPSRIQLLVESKESKDCLKYLKEIIAGGEIFTDKLRYKLKAVTDAKIFNGYGPTETTVGVTFKDITNDKKINIGKPIANTKIYILDKNMIPVPIGISGEIYIGGDNVGRGYLNNQRLTKDRFIPNTFTHEGLIYKSGDMGRWYPKGEIEFIGRIDKQIKIRGFRIELAEIENRLIKIKSIKKAVVVDREDINGKKYLCAYIVSDTDLSVSHIKTFLAREVPYYMVPSIFIKIDDIPLTHNGKIDRKILSEIDGTVMKDHEYEAPRNETEEILVKVWCNVLGINDIGINDCFFDIGGDSLSVIRVQTAVFKYNWNLSTQDFFKYQTIKDLSNRIRGISEDFIIENYDDIIQEAAATQNYDKEEDYTEIANNYKSILVTGSTGYLGIHILHELIHQTDSRIYCLVRGDTEETASNRLLSQLKFYFSHNYIELLNNRIFVINGDIIYEKFGLTNDSYNQLLHNIDAVIHSAGLVKHYGDYRYFESVNVKGTAEMINFALKNHSVIYYISTVSISGQYLVKYNLKDVIFTENDFYIGQHYKDNVYIQSKFEAEKLVHEAKKYGLDAVVYRVGNITGRYSDGNFQSNISDNAFYNKIKAIIKLGYVSQDLLNQSVNVSPVDLCANAIIKIFLAKDAIGRVFHILNENDIKMSKLIDILTNIGKIVKVINNELFKQFIEAISMDNNKHNYLEGIINDFNNEKQLDYRTPIIINSDITVKYLRKINFHWPELDEDYIKKIMDYMESKNFIN